jgi:hypothetical protein
MTPTCMDIDPGEYALRIARGLDRRITTVEESQCELETKIEQIVRKESRRSAARMTWIGAVIAALVGGISQIQVARVNAQSTEKAVEVARQKLEESDKRIDRVIQETARRASIETLSERDRQVDQLSGKR